MGKIFIIYGVHIPRKSIESRHFYFYLTQNLPPNSCHHTLGRRKLVIVPVSIFTKICFLQHQEEVEETIISFIKIQSKSIKITWDIGLLIFCMICIFFFFFSEMMALQFWKQYLSYSMVSILLLLLWNHNNLILKLHILKNSS